MARGLQKQILSMAVQGGLDTKTSAPNVIATDFIELENVVQTETGRFKKRFGYEGYSNNILGEAASDSARAITTFNNQLLKHTNDKLLTWSESNDAWVNKGAIKYATCTTESVASTGYRTVSPSFAIHNDTMIAAYEVEVTPSNFYIEYKVIDNNTGAVIHVGQIAEGRQNALVQNIAGRFFIFYQDDSTLVKFRYIDQNDYTAISYATTISSAVPSFDALTIGTRCFFIFRGTTGASLGYLDANATVNGPVTVASASTYAWVSLSKENVSNVRVCLASTSGANDTILYSYDLNYAIHALTSFSAANPVDQVSSIVDPALSTASYIYYSEGSAPSVMKRVQVTEAGVVGTAEVLKYKMKFQSKPVNIGTKTYFLAMVEPVYKSDVNQTSFLMDELGTITGKFGADNSVRMYLLQPYMLRAPLALIDNDQLLFLGAELAEVQRPSSALFVPTSVKKYVADFSQLNNYFDLTLGENLHFAGGILRAYDGTEVVEHGFLETPQAPTLDHTTHSDGVVPPGSTVTFVCVFAWRDAAGQIHRSAPSPSLAWTNGEADTRNPYLRVYHTPLTEKQNVEIEIYATQINGTIFNKVTSGAVGDRVINNSSVDYTVYGPILISGELLANEALYTTGGVLENIAPDSSKFIAGYKNRIFLLLSDGQTLQYSKIREQNGPVEFNDALKIKLDPYGDEGTCLAKLDDNLIIFKRRALFAMNGEGPNNLGEQDDFRLPQLITSDCGCADPNSLVMTPAGIMFKSEKGIYLLDRALATHYIGDKVEAYNGLTITSATLLSDVNQVRFTTNSDIALVYNYYAKRWSVFTNISGIDSLVYNGAYIVARANGTVMRESTGFSDLGSYISTKIKSAWIHLGQIQGFQRIYKLLLLGEYKSNHKLRVSFAFDYNPESKCDSEITMSNVIDTTVFGSSTYGAGSYGGDFPAYQWDILPEIQKCQAFQFTIQDFFVDEIGEGFTISNFAARVGVKQSTNQLPSSRISGAT